MNFTRIIVACGLACLGSSALSQTGTSGLILDQNRADRVQPTAPQTQAAPIINRTAVIDVGDVHAATIKSIRFDGVAVPANVARAAEAFVGKKASRKTLQALAKAMSDAYAKSPIALYTVAIPGQTLADGVLHVRVAEGFIEAVQISGDVQRRSLDLVKSYATRLAAERPLSRRVLERYLSFMREVPGLTIDVQLLKGKQPGGVVLAVKLKQRRTEFTVGFDNRTSQQFTDGQFQATAKLYGGFRSGDETDIVAAASANFKNYRYLSLAHSTAIGSDGMRLAMSAGYLDTRPRKSNIHGTAEVASITLVDPVLRSYTRNLVLSASIDGINSDNAVLGSLLSSERSRAVRLAASYSDAKPKRVVAAGITISQGLNILGAEVMRPMAVTDFNKVNARASLDQAVGKRMVARLRLSGQWSGDALPAAERFSVGGEEFGRAFETSVLSGDRGAAGSLELAYRPKLAGNFASSELYGFVDGAKVGYEARGAFRGGVFDLASAGTGIRVNYKANASIELEAARAIDTPYPGYRGGWRISVGWRLSSKR